MLARVPWPGLALGLLVLLVAPFALHAVTFGGEGLGLAPLRDTYLHAPDAPLGNASIFAHMLTGAVITLLVPLQLSSTLRRRYPCWHRGAGRVLVVGALLTGVAGSVFIVTRGTIGGAPMDAGFLLYGLLMIAAALQTIRFARARDFMRHRTWALRLFVLAIGSWIYRVHYGLWYLATDGAGSNKAFTGPFDLVQNVAFYLPYLLLLELWLRRRARPVAHLT
ncbi:DUF2306 domain-containing protein [Thalassococcus sp. BH17M4-6]|uniref:DUF2306 domain-containing protein n=1 Tax=Thalassococcus sp. BH17M4-6 TaxID=3413148 RepID=UPI003BDB8030